MHGTWLATSASSGLAYMALALVIEASARSLARLVLCGLAAYAAVKVLRDSSGSKGANSVRKHRLAVLQAILAVLRRQTAQGLALSGVVDGEPQRELANGGATATGRPIVQDTGAGTLAKADGYSAS